jgi:hypothetical protein
VIELAAASELRLDRIEQVLDRFIQWLEQYGETSWDYQTYFAGPIGGRAKGLYYRHRKLGTLAVAPMVFSEALVPSARRFFAPRMRFPIADAHFAMGFAFLARARGKPSLHARAIHFLEELERERCPGYRYWGWGYPFNWETLHGTIPQGTPLITTTPYVYEAFREMYASDKNSRWLDAMASVARHASEDIKDYEVSPTASTSAYTPFDKGGIVNASAYRAFLLTAAATDLHEERYWAIAERNMNFVLESQRPDGSWYYAAEGARQFVDHFHTCFVLKSLTKINQLRPSAKCWQAISKGVEYYLSNLFTEDNLPKPFAKAPRMTVYRRELYDYAECVNLCVLLRDRIPSMNRVLQDVVADILTRWVKPDGSFRSRELWLGWDNVPMHRWAQSQMFRSLSLLLCQESSLSAGAGVH